MKWQIKPSGKCSVYSHFYIFFLIMQKLIDFVSLSIVNYRVAISDIRNFQGRLNNEMNLDGWIFLELTNKNCIVLRFENGSFKSYNFGFRLLSFLCSFAGLER